MPEQKDDFKKVLAYMLGPGFMGVPEPGARRTFKYGKTPGPGHGRLLPESGMNKAAVNDLLESFRNAGLDMYGPDEPPRTPSKDIGKIRAEGEQLKAQMQKMIDEAQAGGQSAEERLKTAMDKLNQAKAAGAEAPPGSAAELAAQDVAQARAVNAPQAPMEPPTFNWPSMQQMGRVGARLKGPAIGVGTGIIGGLLMDYLTRYADQQRALERVRGPYGA